MLIIIIDCTAAKRKHVIRTEFGVFNLGTKQGLDRWHQSIRRNSFRLLGASSSRGDDKNSTAYETTSQAHAAGKKGKYDTNDNSQMWDSGLKLRGSAVKLGKPTTVASDLKRSTRNNDHRQNIEHSILIEKKDDVQKPVPELSNNLHISNDLSVLDIDDGSPSSSSKTSSPQATLSQEENFKETTSEVKFRPDGSDSASTNPTSDQSSPDLAVSGKKMPEHEATFQGENRTSAESSVILTSESLRSRLVEARQKQYRRIFLPGKGWISIQRLEKEIEVADTRTGMENSGT